LRVLWWIEINAMKDSSNLLFPAPTKLTRFIRHFTGLCSNFVHVNFFQNNFGEGFEFNQPFSTNVVKPAPNLALNAANERERKSAHEQ
jgi:hypothetical protein